VCGRSECGAFGLAESLRLRGFETRVQSERLVDQSNQRPTRSVCAGLRQCSERKPVEDGRTIDWHGRQNGKRCRALLGTRKWKPVAYVNDVDLPTQLSKFMDDAPIISIAPGRSVEVSRHTERKVRIATSNHTRPNRNVVHISQRRSLSAVPAIMVLRFWPSSGGCSQAWRGVELPRG
jgi:hypothetical protein